MIYKIIGYRGDKATYIENTLEGFQSILEMDDVDGFELDILVTKDKKLVISHDMFIKDTLGKKHYIHILTYGDLLAFSARVNQNLTVVEKPYLLFDDVLNLYINYSNKNTLLLEIKFLSALEILPLSYVELVEVILSALHNYQILNEYYIISFDYRLLKEVNKQDKKSKVGLILHRNYLALSSILNDISISLLVMEKAWITKEQVMVAKKYNVEIFSYTPNTSIDWMRLYNFGVKGFITDRPKALVIYKKNTLL